MESDELTRKRRRLAVQEIVASETKYVKQLGVIIELYLRPLRNIKTIMSDAEISQVFSNIEIIYGLNNRFLVELRDAMGGATSEDSAALGEVFKKYSPLFKMYTQYVNNHPTANKTLVSISKKSNVKSFLRMSFQNPRSEGLSLESLLITPVQRVPRYRLLLESLLRYTPESSPDAEAIKEALEVVSKVAESINEGVKDAQSRVMLTEVQKMFRGEIDLISPSRKFILAGILTKKERKGDRDLVFFLFNDLLLYGTPKGKSYIQLKRTIVIEHGKFSVEDLPDSGDDTNRFEIFSTEKSFIVCAKFAEDKKKWMDAFAACLTDAEMRAKSRGIATEEGKDEISPVWVPDASSNYCTICLQRFTILKRRHHCRKCGQLVCDDCSKTREKHGKDTKRICDSCVRGQMLSGATALRSSAKIPAISKPTGGEELLSPKVSRPRNSAPVVESTTYRPDHRSRTLATETSSEIGDPSFLEGPGDDSRLSGYYEVTRVSGPVPLYRDMVPPFVGGAILEESGSFRSVTAAPEDGSFRSVKGPFYSDSFMSTKSTRVPSKPKFSTPRSSGILLSSETSSASGSGRDRSLGLLHFITASGTHIPEEAESDEEDEGDEEKARTSEVGDEFGAITRSREDGMSHGSVSRSRGKGLAHKVAKWKTPEPALYSGAVTPEPDAKKVESEDYDLDSVFESVVLFPQDEATNRLGLAPGDIIYIQMKTDPSSEFLGWWYGQNMQSFCSGWIDPAHLKRIPPIPADFDEPLPVPDEGDSLPPPEDFASTVSPPSSGPTPQDSISSYGTEIIPAPADFKYGYSSDVKYVAVCSYEGKMETQELGMEVGDPIMILMDDTASSGYLLCKNMVTEDEGWVNPEMITISDYR